MSLAPKVSTGNLVWDTEESRGGDEFPLVPLPVDTQLHHGAYRVLAVLGQGGFGITYRALDLALQREVAIKEHFPFGALRQGVCVQSGQLGQAEFRQSLQRFQDEGRVLAGFDHPGIVKALAVFEENGTAYLVCQFLEGRSLEDWLTSASLTLEWKLHRLGECAQALEVVHRAGWLHRDVKPSNLVIVEPEQRAVLIDFGSARPRQRERQTSMVSWGYSAPEMYQPDQPKTPACDVYSLAATALVLLTGEPPPDVSRRLLGEGLALPREAPWAATLEKGLALRAQERFASAGEFYESLAASLHSPQPTPGSGQHRAWVHSLCSLPGGWVASAGEDRVVKIWRSGEAMTTLTQPRGWVRALALEGHRLVAGCSDRRLYLWRLGDFVPLGELATEEPVLALTYWRGVWLVGGASALWALDEDGRRLWRTSLGGAVSSLCPWGQEVAVATGQERISLIDGQGRVVERLRAHQGAVKCLTRLSDGRLVSGGSDRCIRVWSGDLSTSLALEPLPGRITALLGDPQGRLLSGCADKGVRLWDGHQQRLLGRHRGEVSALAWEGARAVSSGQDGQVRWWTLSGDAPGGGLA